MPVSAGFTQRNKERKKKEFKKDKKEGTAMNTYPVIGIRPIVDARLLGIREALEGKTREMAEAAKALIENNIFYADGTPARCLIYTGPDGTPASIGGGEEAARCQEQFAAARVCATLSVTPSWCYGSETLDLDPLTIKAIWGFNGTERPGAVYLAAAMAAHNQQGLPAFSIYGRNVQDMEDGSIPTDVQEKLLLWARCALAAGQLRNRAYVNIGSVSMGIMGSYCQADFYQNYLGMRCEWVDMTEVLRREALGIYDPAEYVKALAWVKENCPEGQDPNPPERAHTREQKESDWEFVVKMTLIIRDILQGNPRLAELGWREEALGRNGILGGFQGQRMWTDWKPNGDFSEAILNSSFDWNGKKQPTILATENDNLNGLAMLFGNLLTGRASLFADIRTYWSPDAVQRVTGWQAEGKAAGGFIHLINSGSACLDASGAARDENREPVMKRWWEMTDADITACLQAADWCPAELCQFRGGGFSSHFRTAACLPFTMLRLNLVDGIGPTLQLAEGYSIELPEEVHRTLDERTDPTWPTTWFVPNTTGKDAFRDVYTVMANWGANHGCLAYGHIGAELIALAAMLRIPVSLHNVAPERISRPQSWAAFGTQDLQAADYLACRAYGPLYK